MDRAGEAGREGLAGTSRPARRFGAPQQRGLRVSARPPSGNTTPSTPATTAEVVSAGSDLGGREAVRRPPQRDEQGLTGQEQELLRLLGQGFTDEMASKRLGLSLRTARRMMADLMELLGARSRFEAGLLVGGRGWL